jgi:alkyl hydroperoxide reductase subunit F
MLDNATQLALKGHFARLAHLVKIKIRTDGSAASQKLEHFLQDLFPLSAHLLRVEDKTPGRTPSFAVTNNEETVHIRFSGIPTGHEFTSLILAILQVGGVPPKIDEATRARIQRLSLAASLETFVSLTCQNCPEVVQNFNVIAALNPRFRVEMIEGGMFEQEAKDRTILAVPAMFIDGEAFGQGRMGLPDMLTRLEAREKAMGVAAVSSTDTPAPKAPYEVLVVGGGPAGVAAAIYAARKGIRTGLVSDRLGGQVQDTMAIENFISIAEHEGPRLASSLADHLSRYPVDLMEGHRARRIDPLKDGGFGVELESGEHLVSKTVLLAPGARWRQLGVPGEEEYKNRGVTFCPHCDGPLFKGRAVAVIGGGNSGVEAAIDLAGIVRHVTLVEFDNRLRADEVLLRRLHSLPNVEVVLHAQTTAVVGDGKSVTGLAVIDRTTHQERVIAVGGVFVQIGLVPNTHWLGDVVGLTDRGEIEIDERGQTTVPGLFAAGDATTVPFKQIMVAMGEGVKASLGAFDHLIRT